LHTLLDIKNLLRNRNDAADGPRKGPTSGILIDGLFLAAALTALLLYAGTPVFGTMAVTFVAIVLEALPFMMIGSAAPHLCDPTLIKTVDFLLWEPLG